MEATKYRSISTPARDARERSAWKTNRNRHLCLKSLCLNWWDRGASPGPVEGVPFNFGATTTVAKIDFYGGYFFGFKLQVEYPRTQNVPLCVHLCLRQCTAKARYATWFFELSATYQDRHMHAYSTTQLLEVRRNQFRYIEVGSVTPYQVGCQTL